MRTSLHRGRDCIGHIRHQQGSARHAEVVSRYDQVRASHGGRVAALIAPALVPRCPCASCCWPSGFGRYRAPADQLHFATVDDPIPGRGWIPVWSGRGTLGFERTVSHSVRAKARSGERRAVQVATCAAIWPLAQRLRFWKRPSGNGIATYLACGMGTANLVAIATLAQMPAFFGFAGEFLRCGASVPRDVPPTCAQACRSGTGHFPRLVMGSARRL